MQYQKIINEVYQSTQALESKGQLAAYIPELAIINPNKFGIHISPTDRFEYGLGDYHQPFSIQSIAKVLSLCMAYQHLGESIWERLGVESSGTGL